MKDVYFVSAIRFTSKADILRKLDRPSGPHLWHFCATWAVLRSMIHTASSYIKYSFMTHIKELPMVYKEFANFMSRINKKSTFLLFFQIKYFFDA